MREQPETKGGPCGPPFSFFVHLRNASGSVVITHSGIRFTASAGQSREKLRLLVAQMLGSGAGEREAEDLSAVAV